MLVLTRKSGESIHIGDNIVLKVLSTAGGRTKIGIEAPDDVNIKRGEIDGGPSSDDPNVPSQPQSPSAAAA